MKRPLGHALAALTIAAGAVIATALPAQAASVTVTPSCAAVTTPDVMRCFALRRTDLKAVRSLAAAATPSGLGPSDLTSAYQLPAGGSGATVAIVDAYDDPNAESDLATYRSQYGLPACTTANGCFRKVNGSGQTSPLPTKDSGWAGEISLDVDMVSAVCPGCHILLVEAASANDDSLFGAINTAVSLGAKYVSNSWGGGESSNETTYDSSYLNHPGVAITVSSGDDGTGAEYPASSRYVTAVGGTSLSRSASSSRGWVEKAWSDAGSGCSAYETKPTWQTVTTNCSRRAEADVSAVADPATGVAVYQTYGASGWSVYGGTSASSPIIASVYALAGTPGASDYPASYPYSHTTSLNDVTSGSNGSCGAPICAAGSGWDGPTGVGTPNGVSAFSSSGTGGGGGGGGGGGTCTAGQLLGNPGFESGTSPWTTSSGVVSTASGSSAPHSGTHFAWLDGYGTTHTDTLSQTISIPSTCASAQLSFYLSVNTAETTTSTAYDKLTVKAGSTTLGTYSNLNKSAYAQKTFDLSAYKGQSVALTFTGTEDSSAQTSFLIDDTALNAS
jgi:subtilase family serine protease